MKIRGLEKEELGKRDRHTKRVRNKTEGKEARGAGREKERNTEKNKKIRME